MQPALIEEKVAAGGRDQVSSASTDIPAPDVACETLKSPVYLTITAWLNQIVAGILLIPMSLLIAFAAILTKLSSPGPIIYKQVRVGRRGKTFTVLKIRTMVQNAEGATGPVWTAKNDTRITRVGRFLRKTHLDEIPQLINVVRGDMVLIGPRPERPEFTHYLAQAVPGYIHRLAAKPGITGVAQILLPPDSDLEGVRLKLSADLKYIRRANVWMDIRVMACTSLRLFGISGPKVSRFFGFNRAWIEEPLAQVRQWGEENPPGPIDSSNIPATFAAAMAAEASAEAAVGQEAEVAVGAGDDGHVANADSSTADVPSGNPGLPR